MNARLVCIVGALALFSQAQAGDNEQEWAGAPTRQLRGDYQIYGGTLSDMLPPTRKDRKVAFMFTGALAKELFNEIGPDAKDSCSAASDYRERNRGDLACTYTKQNGYACYFGLDVPTGKSTYGSIC